MDKYKGLEEILDISNIKYNELMRKYTTMRVGGTCDCLVTPTNIEEIKKVIEYAKENNIEYHIIGNGSNLLVSDEGIHALVIKISNKFGDVDVNDETIIACSGVSMPRVSQIAKKNSLAGFEFACGIPGTIGGGIRMNAGAYGGEMCDVVEEVTYLNENNEVCVYKKDELNFTYRHSVFCDNPKYIILSATFQLRKGNIEEISAKMEENAVARKTKQPLEYPSAGSVFKRPEGYFVGKLVADSDLRGVSIGGAQVSQKHTGFIINKGNATCKDVLDLIKHVQDTVYEKFGVMLYTELEVIGGEK